MEINLLRTVDQYGTIIYRNSFGKMHRDNGPAEIYSDGSCYWYYNGFVHRKNGPAQITLKGSQYYIQMGKLNQKNGCKAILFNGNKI